MFADADAIENLTEANVKISGHYHKCNRTGCKDNEKIDDRTEAIEENAVKCTICDYIITPALAHTHHLSLVAGVQATCTQNGRKPY